MTDFIRAYPGTLYIVLTLCGALIVYLWRSNESKSALLIATQLKALVEKLDVLFDKDRERKLEIQELKDANAKLAQEFAVCRQHCGDTRCP